MLRIAVENMLSNREHVKTWFAVLDQGGALIEVASAKTLVA